MNFSAVERLGRSAYIVNTNCLAMLSSHAYNQVVITFDPAKRQANIDKHGIDLADCETVFDAPMLTKEDARESYGGEQRLQSICWLGSRVVVVVWVDRESGPHLISCRQGEKHETARYFQEFI